MAPGVESDAAVRSASKLATLAPPAIGEFCNRA